MFTTHKPEFVIYPQGGSPSAYLASGSGTTSVDDGLWHYVTGRYDGVNVSIWVDGVMQNSRAVSGVTMSNTAASLELGGHCNGASSYPFKGTMDDVRIYARALSAAEILVDMAAPVGGAPPPPPPPPPPPVAVTISWAIPLLNTDGTALSDIAGYRIDYGTDQATLNQSMSVSGVGTSSAVISVPASGTYYFRVTTQNSSGASGAPSNRVNITVP